MLNFRFKLMVLRLLYALLDIQVRRMVVSPESDAHSWSVLMKEARQLIEDYEAQIEDLDRFTVKPEDRQCDSGGEDNCSTQPSTPSEDDSSST